MSKSGYDFYVDKCLLPVTPTKLQIKINNANKTLTLIDEGQINILKKAELTDIEFECEIPQVKYPFAVYKSGFLEAAFFLNCFEALKTSKKPFQFIVSRTLPNGKVLFSTNIKVSMEDYTITEQAKNSFDLTIKIKLKQYRDYSTKIVNFFSSGTNATIYNARSDSTTKNVPIGIGSEVLVNGRLYGDSYGNSPGKTLTDYKGKVNFINKKGSHPYHVTSQSGGWLGWVTASSVQEV